jgi:signal recognition particle subunit SRP54
VKLVKDELTELMGGDVGNKPFEILQLSWCPVYKVQVKLPFRKTGQLSFKQKNKTALVACDIYRPAAIQQLYVVGDSIGVEVYSEPENKNQ